MSLCVPRGIRQAEYCLPARPETRRRDAFGLPRRTRRRALRTYSRRHRHARPAIQSSRVRSAPRPGSSRWPVFSVPCGRLRMARCHHPRSGREHSHRSAGSPPAIPCPLHPGYSRTHASNHRRRPPAARLAGWRWQCASWPRRGLRGFQVHAEIWRDRYPRTAERQESPRVMPPKAGGPTTRAADWGRGTASWVSVLACSRFPVPQSAASVR